MVCFDMPIWREGTLISASIAIEVSGWQHILAFNSTQFKFNLFLLV